MIKDLAMISELDNSEIETFQQLVVMFLRGEALVRSRQGSDKLWRFLERHHGLLAAYFAAAKWEFEMSESLQAAMVRPPTREHAYIFSGPATYMAYILLQLHYEVSMKGSLEEEVPSVLYGELIESVKSAMPKGSNVTKTGLNKALLKLSKFGAVSLPPRFNGALDAKVEVNPVIEMILPVGTIEQLVAKLQQGPEAGGDEEGEWEDLADGPDEDDGAEDASDPDDGDEDLGDTDANEEDGQ